MGEQVQTDRASFVVLRWAGHNNLRGAAVLRDFADLHLPCERDLSIVSCSRDTSHLHGIGAECVIVVLIKRQTII